MSQQESGISGSGLAEWVESDASRDELEMVRPTTARARSTGDVSAEIAHQLNGPLTALLLYIGEIKQHSRLLSQSPEERAYLQRIVDNAFQQTERVCALVKQIGAAHEPVVLAVEGRGEADPRIPRVRELGRAARPLLGSEAGQRPLTKRESEVLQLISDGYSNKRGALRMRISPRTFESHRAEAMRKLGARNTAELVRAALLLRIG